MAMVLTLTAIAHGQFVDTPRAEAAPSGWQWPLERSRQVSRGFLAPATEFGAGHRGIDLPAVVGERLVAPTQVRVAFAGRVVDRDVVTLDAGGGWLATFDGATSTFEVGSVLEAGAPVAVASSTPHCACVHLGLRYRGEYVNPLLTWGEVPRAVLLPW
ncbi:MAG: M23 family metallopeptidase [Aurantimicrobium sp.]|nr:M23 family metallopeptidase [Aurantimicrobium sp.]